MAELIRKVKYYETDRMGITHHSNYVRWMEEARVVYLDEIGYGLRKLEDEGIVSPVVNITCDYKRTTTFDDEIRISVRAEKYTGVRLTFSYTMTDSKGAVVMTGTSSHCFLDETGRPIAIKKRYPELHELLKNAAE